MLWSSAKFATSEPGSCFTVKVSVCVYVRVHFTHVTDMGQPWLLLWHTPTGQLFSKRIFSELQVTITDRVMWNHLDVGTSFFLPCIINLKKKSLAHSRAVFFSPDFTMTDRKKKRNTDWRLQLLRGELCPRAACRSSTAYAIPTWKCSHLLHATTLKMLVSSSIPSTHKQFGLFMLWNTVQNSVTTNLKTAWRLKNIGFSNTAHNYTQQRKSPPELCHLLVLVCYGLFIH